jgi:membrane fusion protein (multidrug efflux system)
MRPALKLIGATMAAALAVGIGAAYGWKWWTLYRFTEETQNAYVSGDITVISPNVGGYLEVVVVDDNQSVQAGEILALIEDADYRTRVDRAQAAVNMKRAAPTTLERRKSHQSALIREAEARVGTAKADVEQARNELARLEKLIDRGLASHTQHDKAIADERRAQAALVRARSAAAAAREHMKVLESEAMQFEAEIQIAEAELRLATTALRHTVIRAPISGVVGNRRARAGEYVRPGTWLFAIVPLDNVWVVANFKETQLTRMEPGQAVDLEIDTFPGIRISGTVESYAPASGARFSLLPPDNATGNFTKVVQRIPVKIALSPDNPLSGQLLPGMSVTAIVHTVPETQQAANLFDAFAALASPLHR